MKKRKRDTSSSLAPSFYSSAPSPPHPLSAKFLQTQKDVAGKTWAAYRTSPLHAFDEHRLSDYAAGLCQHMACECQKVVGQRWRFLSSAHSIVMTGSFSSSSSSSYGRGASSSSSSSSSSARPDAAGRTFAFVVGLQSSAGAPGEEEAVPEERSFLQALLILFSDDWECAASGGEQAARYPMLLIRGNKNATDAFFTWVHSQFDSRVSALHFTPYTLACMAAQWGLGRTSAYSEDSSRGINHSHTRREAPPDHAKSKEPLELVYKAPEHIPELSTIRLTIPAEDMRRLASAMASKQQSDMDKGKDKGFTETRPDLLLALEEHFFYHFRISLSAFVLCRISTPLAHVSTEGKIKLSLEDIPLVLRKLSSFAQE